jgi:serine/threonine protein kinase
MLDSNDCVKIIDFGLMKRITLPGGGPLPGERVGKGGYMPPEVYLAQELADARGVDVWCIGVMLFIMLFGVPPYRTPDAGVCRLYLELQAGRMERLLLHWGMAEYASKDAKDLLQCLLKPRATERLSTGAILAHPWLADMHAAQVGKVLQGTDHDALMAWLHDATVLTQAGAVVSSATMPAPPGSWGAVWQTHHPSLTATTAEQDTGLPAALPLTPEEEDSDAPVLPAAVQSLSNAAASGGAALYISAPPVPGTGVVDEEEDSRLGV